MFSTMSGPNTTSVAVVVHKQATEQLVTAFEAMGASVAVPLAAEAGLDEAVRKTVVRIIEGLR
jgi:hypothetical protein